MIMNEDTAVTDDGSPEEILLVPTTDAGVVPEAGVADLAPQPDESHVAVPPESPLTNTISGGTQHGPVLQGRDFTVTIEGAALATGEQRQAREVFLGALKHREEFVGSFLKQALQQANTTFRISMTFMTAGGLIVLIAAALALSHTHGGTAQPVALVTGLGGLLVGTSGAAFSIRADKARKHLAKQAERMHSQLLDERRFTEVIELLSGIKNADVNDRARVALALKLMSTAAEPTLDEIPLDSE
jgi:hypothetical protein